MRVIGENKTKPNPHPISMQPLRPMWDNHSSRLSNVHGFDTFLRIHKCLEIVPDLRTFVVSTFCFLGRSLHCCPPQITHCSYLQLSTGHSLKPTLNTTFLYGPWALSHRANSVAHTVHYHIFLLIIPPLLAQHNAQDNTFLLLLIVFTILVSLVSSSWLLIFLPTYYQL